jgi:hypothetical protein
MGHFPDLFIDIGTILHMVPFIVAHPHEKIARRAFEPDLVLIREFCIQGGFSAPGTGKGLVHEPFSGMMIIRDG